MAKRISNRQDFAMEVVDLFCGAGGTSTGVIQAAKALGINIRLTAINHWPTAINSHSLNHPEVFHICEPVENLWPPRVIRRRRLRLLCASCECTFHSIARGGGPCSEQSRSQPWQIIRWATDLNIEDILMENVKEWLHWGPLLTRGIKWKGKYYKKDCPDPRRKGEYFKAFVEGLRNLGYKVEWRLQNAADFGDATNRIRLMLIARKRKPILWPEPTHGPGRKHPYRTARDIINWAMPGQSIFNRKKPLSENTMRRIEAGLRKFGGPAAEPFLLMMRGSSNGHLNNNKSVDEPLDTITTSGKHHYLVEPFLTHTTHHGKRRPHSVKDPLPTITGAHRGEMALVQPFVIGQQSCAAPKSVQTPIPTVAAKGAIALVQPCLVNLKGKSNAADVNKPMPTQTAGARHIGLVEPFLLPHLRSKKGKVSCSAQSVNSPVKTITAKSNGIKLVQPIIVQTDQTGSNGACSQSVDSPLGTIVTKQNRAVVEPFIVQANHGTDPKRRGKDARRTKSIDEPVPTITKIKGLAVVEPFILPKEGVHRGNAPRSVDRPISTVTTNERAALVQPFLVKYYGTGVSKTVDAPLDTVTCKDRFLLIEPKTRRVLAELDIRFRMLQPSELSNAHSFPSHYQFTGTKEDQTAQIGNSVPVELAKAHAKACLK